MIYEGYGVELDADRLRQLVKGWEENKAQVLASLRSSADQLIKST